MLPGVYIGLSKREERQAVNYPKQTLSALRKQDLNGIFLRHSLLMSASKISWRSKQSLGTAMCLKQSQITISTFLWDNGAVM
jgi:hypothetical protein